jgi:hypothetical protein
MLFQTTSHFSVAVFLKRTGLVHRLEAVKEIRQGHDPDR